jgi:8-amino-7-oxononanoate synthase
VLKLARLAYAELNPHAANASSQIVPVIIGADEATVSVAQRVQEAGFDVRAIRPPTVPEGTARLRVSINANHTEDQIRALAAAIHAARR